MALLFGKDKHLSRKQADSLVREYYDEIYVFAYKQTFDKELAMDLTQEIFIRFLRSYNSYNSQESSLRTWLYRIAANRIIDYRRSRTARENRFLPLETVEEATVESFIEKIENRELLQKVENFISTFDFTAQQIFRLHIFADLTFSQIADMLGMNESSVKTTYYRLLKQIRKEFGDEA